MPLRRRDKIVLEKILSEIDVGLSIMNGYSKEEFLANEVVKRAIAMTAINIGELVTTVTMELREQYPEIPWRPIAGLRDLAAHKYATLRMEDIYSTVIIDFPKLREDITRILKSPIT